MTSPTTLDRPHARSAESMRDRFYRLVPELLAETPDTALVLAVIGSGYLDPRQRARLASRIIDVGIREQLLVSVAGGLALAGVRPVVHTFAPFLVERPYEQVKLDLGHQGVGALLVGGGGSYDWPEGGETHFGRRDVALLDTLDGWTVQVPGHADEAETFLRQGIQRRDAVYLRLGEASNAEPFDVREPRLHVVRRGSARARAAVVAVGPMLDRTLAATEGLDVTVAYAATVRPFDAAGLRALPGAADTVSGRALPGRHLGGPRQRRAGRPPAPGARAGGRPGRAGALRQRGPARPRARPGPGRHPGLGRGVRALTALRGGC